MTTTFPPATSAGSPDPVERPRAPAGRAVGVVLGALLIASLLNADALADAADQQPYGWRRDVAVAVTRPVRAVARAAGLTLPRRWLDRLTGADDRTVRGSFGGEIDRLAPVERAGAPSTTLPPSTTVPTPTTDTTVARRTPTPAHPLRVLFAGDSLIGNVADGFARHLADDEAVRVTSDVRVGTGLARPDVLDWASVLASQLRAERPEVVVLMFGGNDDQALRGGPGRGSALFTPEWRREYRRRVAMMMDLASRQERTVVWIGMPVVEPERLERARRVMNAVARDAAAGRDSVRYVDTDAVLSDGGRFARRVRVGGDEVEVRTADGVHVTHAGADLLAVRLRAVIAEEWRLDGR